VPKVTAEEFIAASIDYWLGYFSYIPDDAPDGAWWAMHEDGFRDALDDCCEALTLARPDADENDLMHAYLAAVEKGLS
jgi:hypothetical protein